MTKAQVQYIFNTILGENSDTINNNGYTALLNNFMIVVDKEEKLYSDVKRWRYKFDFTNGLIKRILVKPHVGSDDPISGDSYIINGKKYSFDYVMDSEGHILCDIYMMKSIIMFVPQPDVLTSDERTN